jgi:hypothetical protein
MEWAPIATLGMFAVAMFSMIGMIVFSDRKHRPEELILAHHRLRREVMHTQPQLLDVVALLDDLPDQELVRGQVGTVVELLDGAYEVEFCDDEGQTYAELALQPDRLLVLRHRPVRAA